MIKKLLILAAIIMVIGALLSAISTSVVVGAGTVLSYVLPNMPFEFACVIAALSILVGLMLLTFVVQFVQLADSMSDRLNGDDFDEDDDEEEEPEEFAERVAEFLSERFEPHFGKHRQLKSRRR